MRFAPLSLLLAFAAPAMAARAPALPPLLPLELAAAAPLIDVALAGQRLRLTVDLGAGDVVQINPESSASAMLAATTRADGKSADRGRYRVAVGQTTLAIPFSHETLLIAGRAVKARVLTPAAAPPGQPPDSDGTIGLPLLPHSMITLRWRPESSGDGKVRVPARTGRSDAFGFDWRLPGAALLDVELHPLRAATVASAAAASHLAQAGGGRLHGPVRRELIAYGAIRPVRQLRLDRPVAIAGLALAVTDVRLFDWAGRSDLPPDAETDPALIVVGRRGRQGGWAVLKLGRDLLGSCASISWQRQPGQFELHCPAS